MIVHHITMLSDVRNGVAVEGGVPRPPSTAVQIAIRLPAEWLAEADALAIVMARPGFSTTRSDVLRAAIAKGLEVLRAETRPPPASSPRLSKSKKR